MLLTRPRVVVRYPNTDTFLVGTIISSSSDKNTVLCDNGCKIVFNNGSRNIIGSVGKNVVVQVLSKSEAIETILKKLKPYMGEPLKKDKYEKRDRVVLIHEGGGNYVATIKKCTGSIYEVEWDNVKYPDEEVHHEAIIGLAIDKKYSNSISDKKLKEFLIQSNKKELSEDDFSEVTNTIKVPDKKSASSQPNKEEALTPEEKIIKSIFKEDSEKIIQESRKRDKSEETTSLEERVYNLEEQVKQILEQLSLSKHELEEIHEEIKQEEVEEDEPKVTRTRISRIQKDDMDDEVLPIPTDDMDDEVLPMPTDDMDEEFKPRVKKPIEQNGVSNLHQLLIDNSVSGKVSDKGEIHGLTMSRLIKEIKNLPFVNVSESLSEKDNRILVEDEGKVALIQAVNNHIIWEYGGPNSFPKENKDIIDSTKKEFDKEFKKLSELHQLLISESIVDEIKDSGEVDSIWDELLKKVKKLAKISYEGSETVQLKDGNKIVVILKPSSEHDKYITWEYFDKKEVSSEDGQRDGETKRTAKLNKIKEKNKSKLEDD